MNKLLPFLRKLQEQFLAFWKTLPNTKRFTLIGIVALIIFGIGSLFFMKQGDPMEYLFTEVPPEDVQSIIGFFKRSNFNDYSVDGKGIKVPTQDLARLRLQLAQEGLPSQGLVGWEKFDTQDFTRTEFEQQIHRLRAVQGELGRTIMGIEGVMSARVHIVLPKQSLFVEDQKETTAAIYVKMRRGVNLNERQIKGIQHLASRSVEGLKTNNVTIIDADGNMVTKIESEDFASKMTKEMQAYKQTVEKEAEAKIRALVGRVVGPDRVEAKVDATVDFTQEERTSSEVDPEKTAVVSKNTTGANMEGNGLNPTGIPGSKSNVPGEQEQLSMNMSRAQNKQETELINFEVSKTVSKKTMPVGAIRRITAAVLVDGKQDMPLDGTKPVFEPRSAEEIKQIEELVKKSMGFQEGRDEVQVTNMMFQMDPLQAQSINDHKKETRTYISTLAVSGAVALGLMLFFVFIVRPYFRWLSYDPERKAEETLSEEFKPELESGANQNIQVKEDVPFEKMSPKEQILYLAKNEPKRTTEAIRMLLNPHQASGH